MDKVYWTLTILGLAYFVGMCLYVVASIISELCMRTPVRRHMPIHRLPKRA